MRDPVLLGLIECKNINSVLIHAIFVFFCTVILILESQFTDTHFLLLTLIAIQLCSIVVSENISKNNPVRVFMFYKLSFLFI